MVNYFRVTVICSLFYFYDVPTRALDTVSVIIVFINALLDRSVRLPRRGIEYI
jgi:hypothetical protein